MWLLRCGYKDYTFLNSIESISIFIIDINLIGIFQKKKTKETRKKGKEEKPSKLVYYAR